MENLARQKLSELYLKYGADVHQDSRKCEGLLRDACGNLKLEIHVLIEALKDGIAADLQKPQSGIPREAQLALLTQRLRTNTGLEPEAALWAVQSWALVLGKVTQAQLAPKTSTSQPPSKKAVTQPTPPAKAVAANPGVRQPIASRAAVPPSNQGAPSNRAATTLNSTWLPSNRAAGSGPQTAPVQKPVPGSAPKKSAGISEWMIIIVSFSIALACFLYLGHKWPFASHSYTQHSAATGHEPARTGTVPAATSPWPAPQAGVIDGSNTQSQTSGAPPAPPLGAPPAPPLGAPPAPPLGAPPAPQLGP